MVQSISEVRQRSGAGRVPPHNLEAEESLLGAMMLSKDAIAAALEAQVGSEDFYKPAHGHLFEAIQSLYTAAQPVDPVTVSEELRRADLLDAVGGKGAILRIQAGTPSAANAAHYARIVEEHALLRRLIGVAGEISEMGYEMPDDVTVTLDRAETLVFDVAQRRISTTLTPLYEAIQESLDQLERLFESDGTEITGVPTGFYDLDDMLLGLQPSALIVVAARPGQGKTSFALGMSSHVALETRRPVLFFSMEMGYLELTQRILGSEAGVNARLLRTGKIRESDWTKVSHAVGRLAEAPLYIDDNPHLTVMDMRARTRRLKALHGDLGLVVVDYLQLMSSTRRAENRQVEVSELSRGLKILARDLETPVVALSQLNRSLEYRQDKRPMLADLRESGCLTADTRLLRADTGAEVTLGELVATGAREVPVWSLDERWRLIPATLTHAFPSGTKPVYRLRLASGRQVKATANHRFRTLSGWQALGALGVGDRLAVPRAIQEPEDQIRRPEAEVVLLAHLLGGGRLRRQPLSYGGTDEQNLAAVVRAAAHFGVTARRERSTGGWRLALPAPKGRAGGRRNPIAEWLDRLGVFGCRGSEKFVPAEVFSLPADQVALFLRHLWSTGGSVTMRVDGQGRVAPRIHYAGTSRRLAEDVRQLLLRLGIQARVRSTNGSGHRPCHQVDVSGAPDMTTFCEQIGVHGEGGRAATRLLGLLAGRKPNPNVDTIPWEVRDRVVQAMDRSGLTPRVLAAALGEQYGASYLLGRASGPRPFSRHGVEAIAWATGDKDLLHLATSDVTWDAIVEIEPLGEEPVFDATVLGTHNFVANGVVAHNSIEQDADVVCFIYRDESYNPESTDKGTAEIIVAKHRNGPTGKVKLAFNEDLTRFDSLTRH